MKHEILFKTFSFKNFIILLKNEEDLHFPLSVTESSIKTILLSTEPKKVVNLENGKAEAILIQNLESNQNKNYYTVRTEV